MSTTLTPVTIGDRIVSLPEDLAADLRTSRTRLDAMKEEDPEEETDEEEASEGEDEPDEDSKGGFFAKMKAAKAAKAAKAKAKKDSIDATDDDIEEILDHIDALEAENQILAGLFGKTHTDAEDELEDEMTPQEIAIQMIAGFEKAKPFLPTEASAADYADVYGIYEAAIGTRYPDAFTEDESGNIPINPSSEEALEAAFNMMVMASNPMPRQPLSLDSADQKFAESLGLRTDSAVSGMPAERPLTQYY